MAQSLPKVSQPWHFVYPLAYVLVDGKQVANGEVDLVLKRELDLASSHSAYQHTLAVYTKDINPRIKLFLDRNQVSVRYSAQRQRLTIKGSSRSTSSQIHDLRFKTSSDLLGAITRLNEIGIICTDDDGDLDAVRRPQSGTGSRGLTASPALVAGITRPLSSNGSHGRTASPAFLLSAEMVKAGRVMSPLDRRPDGTTPPFCLMRVPKSGRSTPTFTSQTSLSSQQHSQESQFMLSPGQKSDITSTRNIGRSTPKLSSHGSFSPQSSQESHLEPPPKRELSSTAEQGSGSSGSVESTANSPRAQPSRQEAASSQLVQESQSLLPPRRALDSASNPATVADLAPRDWSMTQPSHERELMLPPRRVLNFASKQAGMPSGSPNGGRMTQLSQQEPSDSQVFPESEPMLPTGELNSISKPTSGAATALGVSSAPQLECIPTSLSSRPSNSVCYSSPSTLKDVLELCPTGIDIPDEASSSRGRRRVASTAEADTSSVQPAKRRKLSQKPRRRPNPQQETAWQLQSPQVLHSQSQDRASTTMKLRRLDSTADKKTPSSQSNKRPGISPPPAPQRNCQHAAVTPSSRTLSPQPAPPDTETAQTTVDESSQPLQMLHASGSRSTYQDAQVQTDYQDEFDVATVAEKIHRGNLHQLMIWEELRDALHLRVEAAGDDDQALEQLVEDYEQNLKSGLSRAMNSCL